MKKLLVLLGIGVGIVVGLRFGRAPYEKLRDTLRRPEVAQVVDAVSDKVDDFTDKVATKVDDVAGKVATKVDDAGAKVSSANSKLTD
jgi:hypothetical protein